MIGQGCSFECQTMHTGRFWQKFVSIYLDEINQFSKVDKYTLSCIATGPGPAPVLPQSCLQSFHDHDWSRIQFYVTNHAHWEISTKICFNIDEINQITKVNKYNKVDKYTRSCTAFTLLLPLSCPCSFEWQTMHTRRFWEIFVSI